MSDAATRAGVVGIVLAAGAGTRLGRPKALVTDEDGSWLRRSASLLRAGGCGAVLVVLGAAADRARPLLDGLDVEVVVARTWADGLGASLGSGLRAAQDLPGEAAVITLVDLPDLVPEVVTRLLATAGAGAGALVRAGYSGRPGHPVLLGRDHWEPVLAQAHGDQGARDYLARAGALLVECSDLATGADVDTR